MKSSTRSPQPERRVPERRTPEQWLEIAQREEGIIVAPDEEARDQNTFDDEDAPRTNGRGRHKIFLGFAAGVGKTYKMLEEANRRRARGQDVVIGYIETHKRKGTEAQLGELEIVPRKRVEYRGVTLEEMDTDAILARRPRIVLVDELAHSNVPGSAREKTLARCRSFARCENYRTFHGQCAAFGKPQRHGF